ncbi:MAG: hypothetical protein IIB74_05405 [Proteobacteria bacterium]|nr:hypothetical protein [Pseudomonadota bacterium]
MNDLETIRINNDAEIQFRQLSSGQSIAIIDDFLANPDELRAFAKRHADEFSMPPRSYPGILLDVDAAPMIDIYRFIRSTMAQHFSFLRGDARLSTMLSMTTLQPDELSNLQRLCHNDPEAGQNRRNFAFVLYLFDDERLGGTGFYRWKEQAAIVKATALEMEDPDKALVFLREKFSTYNKPPCYITESSEIAELIEVVPAKFNRLLFYSGNIPHSAQISSPQLLSSDIEKGRLTLNCFASVRPK